MTTEGPAAPTPRLTETRAALLALVVGALAYAGTIPNGWVYDDRVILLQHPVVQGTAPLLDAFKVDWWGLSGERSIGTWRPLVTLWFRLDWWLSGGAPGFLHAVNALVHGLASALVVAAFAPVAGTVAAAAGALFFATFAAGSEAVEGVFGRADVAQAALVLAVFRLHFLAGGRAGAASALLFLAALFTKESAVFLPAALLFTSWVTGDGGLRARPKRWTAYALAITAWVIGRLAVVGAVGVHKGASLFGPLMEAPPVGRIFGAGRILWDFYLRGLVDPLHRVYVCAAPDCGPSTASDPIAWAGLAFFVAFSALPFVAWWRGARGLAVASGFFAVFFAPVVNVLLPASLSYGERLLYVPMAGGAVAFASLVTLLPEGMRRTGWIGLGLVGALNAGALQLRHLDFRDLGALAASSLRVGIDNPVVRGHAAEWAFQHKRYDEAETHARRGTELLRDDAFCWKLLGLTQLTTGKLDEAAQSFAVAAEVDVRGEIAADVVAFLAQRGRFDEALAHARKWVGRSPQDARLRDQIPRLERALRR